jgi:hypothetical protein
MDVVWFYLGILWGVPWLLWQSVVTVEGFVAAVVFVGGPILGVEVINRWLDFNLSRKKYALFAIGLYFVVLLFKSNYDAFDNQKSLHAADVSSLNAKINELATDVRIKNAQNDQLIKENGALAAGGRVLTDAQARVEAVRQQLLEHAAAAPNADNFTPETGFYWFRGAYAMKQQTVADDSDLYLDGGADKEKGTYDELCQSVASLRAIAANITEADLKVNAHKRGN